MKVAFFGGSFDPPHSGHLALARLAIDRLQLDRLLVAPVGIQPLKQEFAPTAFRDRVAMAQLAMADEPRVEVSLVDAPNADGKPNYTIDTVRYLRAQLRRQDRLFCLMGADSFLTIGKWYQATELLMACDFIVGARPGFDLGRLAAALPETIAVAAEDSDVPGCLVLGMRNQTEKCSRLYLLPDLAKDVSATELRRALQTGGETGEAVAPEVVGYIREYGLYRQI
jgi:nicotinate-nucleotide adenylyltransferase